MHLLYMNLHDYKDCKSLTQSQCFYNISNNIPSSLRANCAGFPTCMDDAIRMIDHVWALGVLAAILVA